MVPTRIATGAALPISPPQGELIVGRHATNALPKSRKECASVTDQVVVGFRGKAGSRDCERGTWSRLLPGIAVCAEGFSGWLRYNNGCRWAVKDDSVRRSRQGVPNLGL